MRRSLSAFFLAGTAAALACGGGASNGTPAGADGGADAGTETAASTVEWTPGGHGGEVELAYDGARLTLAARFFVEPTGVVCSRSLVGGVCQLADCTAAGPVDAGTSGASDPAGSLAASGGALPEGVAVAYGKDRYPTYASPLAAPPWSAGDPITVRSTGEWVSAFTTTLAAPAPAAALLAPALGGSDAGAPVVDRAAPLAVRWSGAASGSVELYLASATADGAHVVTASCAFDAATGAAEVPAAVLGRMLAGPGQVAFVPTSTTTLTAGQYAVRVSVRGAAPGGAGAITFP